MHWTLEDLAEKCSVTPHHLSNVERGKTDPHLSTLVGIAKALRVPPGQLLGATDGVSPAAMEVARLYDAASEDVREGVIGILRASGRLRR